jgi:hypothetical protein
MRFECHAFFKLAWNLHREAFARRRYFRIIRVALRNLPQPLGSSVNTPDALEHFDLGFFDIRS